MRAGGLAEPSPWSSAYLRQHRTRDQSRNYLGVRRGRSSTGRWTLGPPVSKSPSPDPQLEMGVPTSTTVIFLCSWIEAVCWRSNIPGMDRARPHALAAKHSRNSGPCVHASSSLSIIKNTTALLLLEFYTQQCFCLIYLVRASWWRCEVGKMVVPSWKGESET